MTQFWVCPVCNYPELRYPPKDHMICPCCGTQFGYDDSGYTHWELAMEWIHAGMPWFSSYTAPPHNWSPFAQMLREKK